eukprot:scaffold133787_cov43-Attheya_sp.AAC.1
MSKDGQTSRRDHAEQQWRYLQQQQQQQQQSSTSSSSAGPAAAAAAAASKRVDRTKDPSRKRKGLTKKTFSSPHAKEDAGPQDQGPEEDDTSTSSTSDDDGGDAPGGAEAAAALALNGQKSMPRQSEIGLVRPCALEEKVA